MLYALDRVPDGSVANKIETAPNGAGMLPGLRLALDPLSRGGKPGIDFVDQPSFLLLPGEILDGAVEVELCARLLPNAPDYARGFIGLAYRVQPDLSVYESLYLRPTNGQVHAPPPPRDKRAVQYYAYPDYPFDVLRDSQPDRFEAGADIALDRWMRFRITFHGNDFAAYADGKLVLAGQGLLSPKAGRIGLWVDIGTEGFFRNLSVHPG